MLKNTGLGTPFINVSFTGFLWGYNDELPCISMSRPDGCEALEGEADKFADDSDDDWGDDGWKRKKRAAAGSNMKETKEDIDLKTGDFANKPQAEYIDCKCQWRLLRDKNVTLKKPVKMHHRMAELS